MRLRRALLSLCLLSVLLGGLVRPVPAQEVPCDPRTTFLTTAKLTWTLVDLPLVGFVLERRHDDQRRWTVLRDDLPPTTLEYLDTDLRPKRTYYWQLRAKLTATTGETVLSAPFAPGAAAPCLHVADLPSPGTLSATPVLP